MKLKEGDIVSLIGFNKTMMVIRCNESDATCTCAWFNKKGNYRERLFKNNLLIIKSVNDIEIGDLVVPTLRGIKYYNIPDDTTAICYGFGVNEVYDKTIYVYYGRNKHEYHISCWKRI